MDRFLQLFGHLVEFAYSCWDRIVLRGYYERLQRPENIVYFFRNVCGVQCITPAVLARPTDVYRKWVEAYARRRKIPLLMAPKGIRKEDFVAPYYQRFRRDQGVVIILKSMEQSSTFVSYHPRFAPPSGSDYRLIKRASGKQFLHYYFYLLDPVMGPMALRVATYLPFTVGCYINGRAFLAQQLKRLHVRFHKDGNAILSCDDPSALERVAATLDESLLQQRAESWALRLAPNFTDHQRCCCQLTYRWSVAQIEFAQDVVFHRRAPLRKLFRRATEIGLPLGGATHTRVIFGRRIDRRYRGKLETVLDQADEGFPVLRAYYQTSFVKQYEKSDRLLRTETVLNDPHHLGLGRHLKNLPAVKTQLAAITDRYLAQQAEILDSTIDTGRLATLAQPVTLGNHRVPGIKLHDDRLIRLLDVLLHTTGLLADWTTRDLHSRLLARHRLTESTYSLSQLRYDLRKLRAHNLAQRVGNTRRYRLTIDGVRTGALLVKLRHRLLGPILAEPVTPKAARSNNPSTVEAALRNIDRALDQLCDSLALKAAA